MEKKIKVTNRTQEVADKEFDALFDELVPGMGKAETKAGEIVRAMARIGHRYFWDGDMIGVGYGKETCNPAARFLGEKLPQVELTLVCITGISDEKKYEEGLLYVENYVIDYIAAHPELKEQPNDEDYFDWRDDEIDVDDTYEEDENDYEEEYDEEEY